MIKAVIFDRDGTLIEYVPYLSKVEQVTFYEGVIPACKRLVEHNIDIFIATNQSGIGRGYYSEAEYKVVETHIENELKQAGIVVKQTLFSPYHPTDGKGAYLKDSNCRKPNPGMLQSIITDYQLIPDEVIMVGDSKVDILAAKNAGVKSALVRTGLGLKSEKQVNPSFIGDTIVDVVDQYILPML